MRFENTIFMGRMQDECESYTAPMRVQIKPDFVRTKAAQMNTTLEHVARSSGIHPSHFYKILAGEHSLYAGKRRALQATLEADFADLFEVHAS
jgi:hypothetical protein